LKVELVRGVRVGIAVEKKLFVCYTLNFAAERCGRGLDKALLLSSFGTGGYETEMVRFSSLTTFVPGR